MAATLIAGCDSIDCTLENNVEMNVQFYQEGNTVALTDTLTITGGKSGPVLLNKKAKAGRIELPLSYYNDRDTLVLKVKGEDFELEDTVWVEKRNVPHYESPDCPLTMFHEITGVSSTHVFIKDVTISRAIVDYAKIENIQIHLNSDN